jgi:hypothetical protein
MPFMSLLENGDYRSYESLILFFILFFLSFSCIEIFHSLEDVVQLWRVSMYRHIE